MKLLIIVIILLVFLVMDMRYVIVENYDNYYNIRNTDIINGTPDGALSVVTDTYLKIGNLENDIMMLKQKDDEINKNSQTLIDKLSEVYTTDTNGDYIVNGWFVQVHNVIDTPSGVILGAITNKLYGVPIICSKSGIRFPFLGYPDRPILLPKSNYIGFRAMTLFKVDRTGIYDFTAFTDDGIRLYVTRASPEILVNEKNIRTSWNLCIDSWLYQSDIWTLISEQKFRFYENELVLIRMDHYEIQGKASACVKLRYYPDETKLNDNEIIEQDLPYNNIFCSLLWSEVPLFGYT